MVRICVLGFHVFCEWSVKRNCLSDRWKEQYVNEEYAHCCFFQHFHMTTTHKWEKCIACIFVHGSCVNAALPFQRCRRVKAIAQANQGQWTSWEGGGKRKISWQSYETRRHSEPASPWWLPMTSFRLPRTSASGMMKTPMLILSDSSTGRQSRGSLAQQKWGAIGCGWMKRTPAWPSS